MVTHTQTVAGIDIGGEKKGCHLAILRGADVVHVANSPRPAELLQACLAHGVRAVGIDGPCGWATAGSGRLAERELARRGISFFSAPTREKALSSASGFYDWMLCGEAVYRTFAAAYPLLSSPAVPPGRASFETFPHAITCAVRGAANTSAKRKRIERRELLEAVGIDSARLRSIDEIDATLCAWTARCLLAGHANFLGDAEGGYMVVPNV